jgi:hypothetical protein
MELPATILVELELSESNLLGQVADAAHVDTKNLSRCEISTTINNIRYGTYTSQGVPHEACVIFFCFEVGKQRKRAERLKELEIQLSVFRAPGAPPPHAAEAGLEIRLREPERGRSKATTQVVNRRIGAGGEVGYQFAGVNGGFVREEQQEELYYTSVESTRRGTASRVLSFRLSENGMLKDGVPEVFECALVLRTDGIPFSISAEFEAMLDGSLFTKRKKAQVMIGESYVQRRLPSKGTDDACTGLDDMDSEKFKAWMKGQLHNQWMV